jgi:hypothetical protein
VPQAFTDVGAGGGSWLDAMRPWFPYARWTAVEVWEPYVAKFDLLSRYHAVLVGDVREVALPFADVTLLGDVLEHMSVGEAVEVWERARAQSRLVIASVPLGEHPQGHVHGNAYETHRATWTHDDVLMRLPGVKLNYIGEIVGVYVAEGAL